MRDIYYEELRKICAVSVNYTTEQIEKMVNAIKKILVFQKLARQEGLLYMEKECESLDKETEEKYLSELLIR